jgi:hypothetical protein
MALPPPFPRFTNQAVYFLCGKTARVIDLFANVIGNFPETLKMVLIIQQAQKLAGALKCEIIFAVKNFYGIVFNL